MKNRKEQRSGENERKGGEWEGREEEGQIAFPPFCSVCSYLVFPPGVGMRC